MRKIYYDTEFLEDGSTIDLISIGAVSIKTAAPNPYGGIDFEFEEYYAINSDAAWNRILVHPFLSEHVVPHLPMGKIPNEIGGNRTWVDLTSRMVRPKWLIRNEMQHFLLGDPEDWEQVEDPDNPGAMIGVPPNISLVADYCAYDHVALAQLWGTMMDLPDGVPMWTNDFQQVLKVNGITSAELEEQIGGAEVDLTSFGPDHHALADAKRVAVMDWWLGEGKEVMG